MRPTIVTILVFSLFQSLYCLSSVSNTRLNYFDIDLLRYVAEGKRGNVMVSPASIKSTLAMLLEGAHGVTATEIQMALRLTPNKEDYREQLSFFLKDLEVNTPSVSVHNANGLFVSKKLQLKKEYEMMAKRVYFSDVNKMDFNDPRTAADLINGWVSSKTRGLIPSIIEQAYINPLTELLVTNALYFKGTWLHQFESKLTHGDCFYRDGICRSVAMMDLEAELNYAYVDNLRAHALELPYQGKRYSMILLVPRDRDAEVALIRDLPYLGLLQISKLMVPTDVVLTMPKFTVEYSDDMVGALRQMRIRNLFTPSANLSGIIQGSAAYLNSIYHKVYMSVDEKGTVAAAASAGIVVPLINNLVQLRVDRPFLFFIWDNEKGVVLFEGKIEEPTELIPTIINKFGENIYNPQQVPIAVTNPNMSPSIFIQPMLNQSANSQPIQPVNSQSTQPVNSQFNQYGYNQPANSESNQYGYNQQIKPVNNQPIQPANSESNQYGYNQQIKPVNNQPIQPANSESNQYDYNQQIQPVNSQYNQSVYNQPIQSMATNQPISRQPITEYTTTTEKHISRTTESSWFQKVSSYFG